MRNAHKASRLVSAAVTTAIVAVTLLASSSHAALRSPQVPVSGTALQTFFGSQGQTINVNADQVDVQTFSVPLGSGFQVLKFIDPSANVGVYNAAAVSPALYLIFPGAAGPGWFTMASFRASPDRLIVDLFDNNGTFVSTVTYLGADHTNFGFYAEMPGGLAYSQDSRDPSGRPQMLAFSGTGVDAGLTWLAFENAPGPGSDFADAVALVGLASGPVPTKSSSWARVKALFR
jgi:hypothetical protein